ncbi:MAG: hypothetical protein ABL902_02145 [Gallionella sp.]
MRYGSTQLPCVSNLEGLLGDLHKIFIDFEFILEIVMTITVAIKNQRTILLCILSIVSLCVNFATISLAADEPAKTSPAINKVEPLKQSGSFLIKFEASASQTKIDEVADYYGASKVLALSDSESSSRKDPERWRKLRFDAVDDVKNIARRIFQDMSVDEVDEVIIGK